MSIFHISWGARDVTARIRAMEKIPSQKQFDRFLLQCCKMKIDLAPWKKRLESLRRRILLAEVHDT
jgi:hypothetical protein